MILTVVLGIGATLAEGIGISLFIPFLQGISGNAFAGGQNNRIVVFLANLFGNDLTDRLGIIATCIFLALVVKALLNYFSDLSYSLLEARIGHEIRVELHERLLDADFGLLERTRDERLFNTLVTESWKTIKAVTLVVYLMIAVATMIIFSALLLMISWRLTILVAVCMIAISLFVRLLRKRVELLGRVATWSNLRLTGRMIEALSGMETIRSYGMESFANDRFTSASKRVSDSFLRLSLLSGLVGPIYEVLTAGLLVVLLVVSFHNEANIPAILVFIFILHRLQPRIKSIDGTWLAMESMKAPVNEVLWLLDQSPDGTDAGGQRSFTGLSDAIEFRNVSFAYDRTAAPALADVNVRIPRGTTTALVGPSGSGKSTFVKLILRLYEPQAGSILADGHNLNEYDIVQWKAKIAVVNQDPYLFNASAFDNITFGLPGADAGTVEAAARKADAHDFIRGLPRGYRTNVGDDGGLLSGGQKQRISMARALIRQPDILILDEATNALDSISEDAIQRALEALPGQCTRIVIAHRLSTIESADQILVLDKGRVVEAGSFRTLLEMRGLFADLHRRQRQGEHAFD